MGIVGQAGVGWVHETEAALRLPIQAHGEHPGPRGGVGGRTTVVGGGDSCEDLQQVVVGHAEDREAQQGHDDELEGALADHAVHECGEGHGARQDEPELRARHQAGERRVCAGMMCGHVDGCGHTSGRA